MSLFRQLLVLLCSVISAGSLLAASFLLCQKFLIIRAQVPIADPVVPIEITAPLQPTVLHLPNTDHALPIEASVVEAGEWNINNRAVSWLAKNHSDLDQGIILYGHNWASLLGSLSKVQVGQNITVDFNTTETRTYTVTNVVTVNDDDVEILKMASPNTVLIYTCAGFLDTQRLVVVAHRF